MKMKTYRERDDRFKKASAMVSHYINEKMKHLDVDIGYLAPTSMRLEWMTLAELGEYNLPPYQRELQHGRLRNIADTFVMFRYDLSNPIVVTEPGKNFCDGNHRQVVACCGLPPDEKVPVVVLEFETPAQEALYFKAKQTPPGGAPVAPDRVKAAFFAKEPYAIALYKLALIDPRSLFAGQVGIRKNISKKYIPSDEVVVERFSKKAPIPVGPFLRIYHWIGLEYRRTWERRKEDYLNQMVLQMDYEDILDRMNFFAHWLYSWAGEDLSMSKDLFREPVITGFLDFFLTVLNQPHITESRVSSILKISSNVFRKWAWYTTKLMTCKPEESLEIVLTKYNGNRSTNRLVPIDNLVELYGVRALDSPEE